MYYIACAEQGVALRFLLDLNERCTNGDAEYAERTKMRNTELAAVSEAVAMLTDDSARDLFSSDTRDSNAEHATRIPWQLITPKSRYARDTSPFYRLSRRLSPPQQFLSPCAQRCPNFMGAFEFSRRQAISSRLTRGTTARKYRCIGLDHSLVFRIIWWWSTVLGAYH